MSPQAVVGVELVRDVIRRVDPDLLQRLENPWMGSGAGVASCAARFVPVAGDATEEPLGHDATAAVADAHEQDVAHDSSGIGASWISPGRVCSPRTNW
jgi:hypothetical protein